MTYQVLARKWRPQDFAGVVGQQPIVTALSNAIGEGRIAQAYLFSGIRGVGKTSVARIFAKALNCEQGPTPSPCGECASCSEIAAGTNLLDVIEIDAATYSKVEQVRELTESLKYGPARDRYKVVILDEIHRLSRQAFDALLKIVEEPPDHLVFVFATTEIESVPATILSRCQEFRFRRVGFEELVPHLETLAEAEEIEVGPTSLRLIARASDGSVRDAVALLDQLATFGSGRIDDEDAAGILGGVDSKLFRSLLESVLEGRASEVSAAIHEIEEQGWDPRYVFTEFLRYCRSALHLALGADAEHLDLPREESVSLAKLAKSSGYENILRLLHLLLNSEETVRRSESGLLAVEIAWLRGAELPKLVAIESLMSGAVPPTSEGSTRSDLPKRSASSPASGSGKPPGKTSSSKTSTKARKPPPEALPPEAALDEPPSEERITEKKAIEEAPAEESPTSRSPVSSAGAPSPAPSVSTTSNDVFLAHVSRQNQALAAHLAGAISLAFASGELKISVPIGDTWIQDRLRQSKHRKTLEHALVATWGETAKWLIVEVEGDAPAQKPQGQEQERAQVVDDPQVQKILDIFGGSVESAADGDR